MAEAELDILPSGNSPAITINSLLVAQQRKDCVRCGLVVGFFAVAAIAGAAINIASADEASDIATAIAFGDATAIDIASGDETNTHPSLSTPFTQYANTDPGSFDSFSGSLDPTDPNVLLLQQPFSSSFGSYDGSFAGSSKEVAEITPRSDPEDMLVDYLASQAELMYSTDEAARYPDDDSAKPYFEHASGLGYKFHILYREQTSKRPDETSYKKHFVLTESAMAFANDANGNQWNWVRITEDLLNVQWKALGLDAYDLTNKNIVITGASRGIGFDLAVRCAQIGFDLRWRSSYKELVRMEQGSRNQRWCRTYNCDIKDGKFRQGKKSMESRLGKCSFGAGVSHVRHQRSHRFFTANEVLTDVFR
jgi:hypothetical protein